MANNLLLSVPIEISQIIWKYVYHDVIRQINSVFSYLHDFKPFPKYFTKYKGINSYCHSEIIYGKCGCQVLNLVSNRINDRIICKDFYNIYVSIFNSKRLVYFDDIFN